METEQGKNERQVEAERKRERQEEERKKGETEMDIGAKILTVAGGKLISPTVFHFCVEKSRHIDYRLQEFQITTISCEKLKKHISTTTQQQKTAVFHSWLTQLS